MDKKEIPLVETLEKKLFDAGVKLSVPGLCSCNGQFEYTALVFFKCLVFLIGAFSIHG